MRKRGKCLWCGSIRLYRHGMCELRQVLHTCINGTKVYFRLHRQRFRYLDCRHTFTLGKKLAEPRSRLTRQAEAEALWQLRHMSFSQLKRKIGISYGALRPLLDREIEEEAMSLIGDEVEIYLGSDEHSFKHKDMVHIITETKQTRVTGMLRDDRIATSKRFPGMIPQDKVKEVCVGTKDELRKAVEGR